MNDDLCHEELIKIKQANKFAVSPKIHADDHIFQFLLSHPNIGTYESAVEYYFQDGDQSAGKLLSLLSNHLNFDRALDVLEFASGYGMVTRHLAKKHNINLWSCDIHPAAVEFLRNTVGVRAVQSADLPEMLLLAESFDAVFALSFFSHMPITTWCRWLVRLTQAVRPGGVIIFTTHGQLSRAAFGNPLVSELGFWFNPSSEQKDLSTETYGSTIATEFFVRKNLLTIPSVELLD